MVGGGVLDTAGEPADGGLTVNGYVFMSLGLAPIGEYTAEIYATDGERTETDPLKIVYKERCW